MKDEDIKKMAEGIAAHIKDIVLEKKWMTLSQACRYTNRSKKYVRKHIKDKHFFAYLDGKAYQIDRDSIDKFFYEN